MENKPKKNNLRTPKKETGNTKKNYQSNTGFSKNKFSKDTKNNKFEHSSNPTEDTSQKSKPKHKLPFERKPLFKKPFQKTTPKPVKREDDGTMRLNRYIANAGVCSRREADTLILSGAVSVNGKIITELGVRVLETDKVTVGKESIKHEQKVYVLMNKPKNFITSVSDPKGRKTVMQLVGKLKQRVYPVGRLDRATTGVLMFTNDGDLAKKLTHPRYKIKKIYQVTTDKNVPQLHIKQISEGIELEDGWIKADEVSYVGKGEDRREIGIEIHSGKNRIVRRIFEHLGYDVIKLDRVYFAGLTKKDLARGQWRYLTEEEVNFLKMLPG
ncbi:MAG: rRNA pseudouridine synthase [Flavobacteriales bacterium]|nr:rRNA pseudouridine synthase [Flavobacteriales bacterium]